ncbi:hypothetical protein [Ammoniphilus sp. CFH 90114]|uniref:hypothetical protein n=1 Tax=Ammoniphilus sp. CFH 90114 TaxID=2493665 RepID=UPI00100F996F|nr:hypothetical protein [Ammoniphilus sp. CFH 90114]RXT14930.1 hypothetical protein EIZ39_01600 [Ammoniphilus sp. CFH 90114]
MEHQIIDLVTQWMKQQEHRSILISKEEDGDLDQVSLTLEDITLGKLERPDPDGYVSPQSLLFHGQGQVINETSGPLPQDVYEIPLFGTWITQNKGDSFQIRTERGIYTIQPH